MTRHYFFKVVLIALIISTCLVGVVNADTTYHKHILSTEANTTVRTAPGDGSETLAEIRVGAGTGFYGTTHEYIYMLGSATTNELEEINRVAYSVDTSSLPDTITITGITIGIYVAENRTNMGNPSLVVTGFNPTTNGTITIPTDYSGRTDTQYTTPILIDDLFIGWHNLTGNAAFVANISKTGYTNFMIRDYNETINSLPGWSSGGENFVDYDGAEHGTNPMWIDITYTTDTAPTAAFSGTPTSGTIPLSVVFTDGSSGAGITEWNWSFGDGNYSSTQHPTHEYAYVDTFDVNLTVTSVYGTDSELKTGYIITSEEGVDPYAGFVPDSIEGAEPLSVTFTDISYNNPTSRMWNKTDVTGANVPITFSIIQTPTHSFSEGNWSIQLYTTNVYGSNLSPVGVFVNVTGGGVPPVANFTQDKSSIQQGEYVQFTDDSTGSPTSWNWEKCHYAYDVQHDLGTCVGGWTSFATEQNPLYNEFVYEGGYTGYWIRMTATNVYGSDTVGGNGGGAGSTYLDYHFVAVTAIPSVPVANFTPVGDYQSGNWWHINISLGTQINFTDTSTNTPTSWNWSFQRISGFSYSNEQNPSFLYDTINATSPASYGVTLIASNAAGSNQMTKYVSIYSPPVIPIARLHIQNDYGTFSGVVEEGMPSYTNITIDTAANLLNFYDVSYNTPTSAVLSIDAGNGTIFTYYTDWVTFSYTDAVPGYYPLWYNVTNDAGTDSLYFPTLMHVMDFVPPASVSGIINTTGSTTIKWNWTNPTTDVAKIMVWKNGTFFENITFPQNGTTWTGLNPSTSYAIATKTVDASGNANATFVNSTAQTGISQWTYYCSPTTQYWTAPIGVTEITLDIGSGGGSGACSDMFMGWYYLGYGGKKGETETVSHVTVVPGTTYSVTVGCGGPTTVYSEASHAGTNSRFEGGILTPIIKTGGLGGLKPSPRVAGNGTAGEDGFLTGGNASWGYNGTYHSGGAPGSGWSAGGGAASGNQTEGGNGGKGSDGIVRITVYGTAGLNTPDFTADRTTGEPGTLIHFIDLSLISDPDQLTYNWTFGDGEYSSSTNPQHVYSYTGTYDVSLTLANVNGSITETKPEYINIATSPITVYYLPQQVRMRLIDTDSYPLSGVTIAATPLNFTAPENWTELLLGISSGVNIMGTTVSGVTGSDGSWVAPMVQSILYNISMTRTPDINYAFQIYPSQSEYVFTIPLGVVPIPTSIANIVTYSLSNATINATHQFFNVTYSDTSTQGTDKLSFYVYDLGGTLLASNSYTGASANSQTFSQVLAVSQGQSYTYGFAANQSRYGWINQTDTVTFANQVALIGAAPSWVEEFAAIAIIIIFSALFSIWSKAIAMIAMPLLTYFFQFAMGWLPSTFLSSIALGVMLTLGVLIYIRQKENMLT